MTITIRKKSQPQILAGLLILMPLFIGALAELSGALYSVRYLMDAVWLLLLVLMMRFGKRLPFQGMKSMVAWVVLFFLYALLSYIPQYQSGLYFLWAARNNFRFYVAFFAFAVFLTDRDIKSSLSLYDKVFWLNFLVSLIQFFLFDLEQDYLGGIFGAERGTNGYSNIFMVLVMTKSIVFYLDKQENALQCFSKCIASLLVAALAEMKFFFFEFILIIILATVYTDFSWRKLLIVVGGVACTFAGAALLTQIFPYFSDWFSLEWLLETALSTVGYTGSGDLNRLTAIPSINLMWLKNWGLQLFGLGMGNCETSSVAVLNTPFFRANGDYHYSWISYAMMYLECGWIGLVFYFSFFAMLYFKLVRIQKRADAVLRPYCVIAKITVIMAVLLCVYNNTMRAEPAYMMFLFLAMPFALRSNRTASVSEQRI